MEVYVERGSKNCVVARSMMMGNIERRIVGGGMLDCGRFGMEVLRRGSKRKGRSVDVVLIGGVVDIKSVG